MIPKKFKKLITITTLTLVMSSWLTTSFALFGEPNHNNLWSVVTGNFSLVSKSINNPNVQNEITEMLKNKAYFTQVSLNAEPYLYYVYQQVQKRNMPAEMAFLPMIESNYYPFSLSGPGANGLWQFMPAAAKDYNLSMNWWFEGRQDIPASTQAALDYLVKLHNHYHDWYLALAAYNAGPGVVNKAIKVNQKKGLPCDFWSLKLPKETENYVPKLLAVSAIIKDNQHYHVKLNPIANKPAFTEISIDHPINLAELSQMIKMDSMQLLRLNPDFRRWITPPQGTYTLLVPVDKATQAQEDLSKFTADNLWMHYTVKNTDTLNSISKQFALSTDTLVHVNNLSGNHVSTGQTLLIPYDYSAPNKNVVGQVLPRNPHQSDKVVHQVFANESIKMVAQEYHTTPAAIKTWNELSSEKLQPGQTLAIWLPAQSYFATYSAPSKKG